MPDNILLLIMLELGISLVVKISDSISLLENWEVDSLGKLEVDISL